MSEKRKFARIKLDKTIKLKFKGKEQFVTHLLRDISMGGMFLKTSEPMEIGNQFNFEFSIDADMPNIVGRGIVVRTAEDLQGKPYGVGIKFVSLEGNGKEVLAELIKLHGKKCSE